MVRTGLGKSEARSKLVLKFSKFTARRLPNAFERGFNHCRFLAARNASFPLGERRFRGFASVAFRSPNGHRYACQTTSQAHQVVRLSRVPAPLRSMLHRVCRPFLDPPRADMALHRDADMVWAVAGTCRVKFLSSFASGQGRTRSPKPELCALGLRPADLLPAALGGRPRPRGAAAAFTSAAEADLGLLPGGVLPTRVSTRSAVSRSVN
jgi:hypothetical protein